VLPIFRNTSPYTVILLLIITVLLKLRALLHPIAPVSADEYYLYDHILRGLNIIFNGNAFAFTLLAAFNTFCQAMYLNGICNRRKLFLRTGYIPALTFILLSSIYPAFNYFSLPVLLIWFLLGSLDVVSSLGQTLQPRKQIFNAGFLLSMAAMMQFSAVVYFIFLLVCLIVLRPFNISEWVVGLMGYLTPVYFSACILFLLDKLEILYDMPDVGISLPGKIGWQLLFLISGLLILFFSGLYALQLQTTKVSIYVRRNWVAFIIFLILSVAVAIFTSDEVKNPWLITILPLSLVISNAFSLEKSKWFSNFAFYFSLLFVVACQWAIK